MRNRVVMITGANGGLGAVVTQVFLSEGCRVAGVALGMKDADPPDARFLAVSTSLSSLEAARAAVQKVIDAWGQVDALLHLVGGFSGGTPVTDTDDATLERMLDINVRSAFHILRAVLPGMRERGRGRIVAIGARPAVEPVAGLGVYAASKAALVTLVRTVALENKGRNISANVILPGTMDTPGNRAANPTADFSQWVQPAQIAHFLVNLAGCHASQITGAVIPIYGGDL
jgi:NAD(P)-dependent dehydrogenase (short-subunit alcohol dehydrogenase family)